MNEKIFVRLCLNYGKEPNKELYELKLRYQPMLNNIIKNIPDQEKNTIKCFLENEIGLKVTD